MRLRWTFVTAAAVFVAILLLLRSRAPDSPAPGEAEPLLPVAEAHTEQSATPRFAARPATAQIAAREPSAPPASADTVGVASGSIHFERRAADGAMESRAGGAPAHRAAVSRIDVNVQAAIGLWQPGEHRLRVALLERAPTPAQSAQLLGQLESGATSLAGILPAGIVDLRFMPTAQAFDRNELETAALVASNIAGESGTADVLGSLDWTGSLPSPRAGGAPAVTRLELSAAGSGVSADRPAWQQQWQFTVSVPVSLAR